MAPALLILFCFILIPMLDMLYLALAYAAGWYCNHLVVREVACRDPANWATAETTATQAFCSSGLGSFLAVAVGNVQNSGPPGTFVGNPPTAVTVVTVMTVRPMLPVPLFMTVPGMNAPVSFRFAATRPQEETGQK